MTFVESLLVDLLRVNDHCDSGSDVDYLPLAFLFSTSTETLCFRIIAILKDSHNFIEVLLLLLYKSGIVVVLLTNSTSSFLIGNLCLVHVFDFVTLLRLKAFVFNHVLFILGEVTLDIVGTQKTVSYRLPET